MCNIVSFSCCEYSFFFIFTGVPVNTTFAPFLILSCASLNDTNIVSAFPDNIFTALPGKALLSCNNVGIFRLCAAEIVAPQIYPPVPITISGLNSFIIFLASPNPFRVLYIFFRFSTEIFLLNPYASIVFNLYPALGTKSFSSPLVVPIKIISESFSSSFILFAIAKPGFICPPVPAAAIITFILNFFPFL